MNVSYNILLLDLSTNVKTANPNVGSFLILHLVWLTKINLIGCRHPFFFAALFFFAAITCPALSSIKPKDDNEYLEPGIDYLENLPENDYIIGPGDTLNVVISRDYPEIGMARAMVDGEGTLYLPKLEECMWKD